MLRSPNYKLCDLFFFWEMLFSREEGVAGTFKVKQ